MPSTFISFQSVFYSVSFLMKIYDGPFAEPLAAEG